MLQGDREQRLHKEAEHIFGPLSLHDEKKGIYIDKETSFKVQPDAQRQEDRAGRDTRANELFHNFHKHQGPTSDEAAAGGRER